MTNPIPTISITEDLIVITLGENELRFEPSGGPEDPLIISCGDVGYDLSRTLVDRLQRALLNFLNTGYFDLEG